MGIINFNERKVKKIERLGLEKLGAIKIGEDNYIIPSARAYSDKLDFECSSMLNFNIEAFDKISELECCEGDSLAVVLYSVVGDKKTIEISNITRMVDSVYIELETDLTVDERHELVNTILAIVGKKDVRAVFFIRYNFEQLSKVLFS